VRGLRKLLSLVFGASVVLAGCSGGGNGSGPSSGVLACSASAQKRAVAELMQEWYLFNDEPEQQQAYETLDLDAFATAEALLESLLYRPERFDRNFSYLTTVEADQQFFEEGQFVGFGFGSKFADAPLDTDLRLTQVIAGSPAAQNGFERGQQLLAIDDRSVAEIAAAEGLSAALGPADVGVERIFSLRRADGTQFDVSLAKALVTIDPVVTVNTFDAGGLRVGYIDFRTFVSTADAELEQAFATFEADGVAAVIVDLRYNGGGLVTTAELLADLIGGFLADGSTLSQTLYNSAKQDLNTVTPFRLRANSLSLLQQVVFITTPSSASASELVINALEPHTVVRLVGAPTFGKPVGQNALRYCDGERLLRAVTFETVNSLGEGGYYDGLLVDCPEADDLGHALGDPTEASLAGALSLVESFSCAAPKGSTKPAGVTPQLTDVPFGVGDASARRHAGLF
jgi:carboxyl-terminal processing protease